jgi:CRISPR-associated protein Cpf1
MKTSIFDEFTNQYSVQKTLRFALEPVGETAKHIKDGELLKKDEELARKYKLAKIIIDEYHKDFIHKRLSGFSFKIEDLEDFKSAYEALKADKKNKDEQDKLGEKQEALRKLVSEVFKNDRLFQKEFIKEDLPTWLEQHPDKVENNEEAIGIVKDFEKWTSYFDGFNENRKNIYTAESHSTSISYRLIHENLPRFIDNILRYEKAKELGVDFSEVGNYFDVKLDNVFSLSYFNNCLTQRGIDEYNKIRGGQSKRGNIKEQGVNEKINEYAQQLASQKNNTVDEKKKELKDKRKTVLSCKLEKLHKQILSDRTEISSRLQNINNDGNLCEQIQLFQLNEKDELIGREEIEDEKGNKNTEDFNITKQLREILESISEADAQSIYIKNGKELANISQFLFGDWDVIKRSLENYAENRLLGKNKKGESKRFTEQARESWLKSTYFSFDTIHKALKKDFEQYKDEDLVDNKDEGVTIEMKKKAMSEPLFRYFENLMFRKKNEETDVFEEKELLDEIIKLAPPAFNVLKQYKGEKTETLKNNKKEVSKIKVYLDAVQDLQQFLKPLFVKQKEKEHADVLTEKQPHRKKVKQKEKEHADVLDKDSAFYGDFDRLYEVLEQITPLYNQTRNYLTKKPYNIEKYKLNFENITLADGWDKNKETDNTCVLLRKGEKYFLGVMDRRTAKLFESDNLSPKSIEDSMAENIKKIEEHKAILLNKKEGTKDNDSLLNKFFLYYHFLLH